MTDSDPKKSDATKTGPEGDKPDGTEAGPVEETGGRKGLDPTRFGDWEKDGRCIDF